jgi:hypothetical protein
MFMLKDKVLAWLDGGSIGTAFTAAVLWWLSARVHLPAPGTYWMQAPETDPFLMAIRHSADLSGWAARFAAVSVVLTALASWVRSRQIWPPARYARWRIWIAKNRL